LQYYYCTKAVRMIYKSAAARSIRVLLHTIGETIDHMMEQALGFSSLK
jgi:hypothetical protein